jgi:hypothetical protein
MTIKKKIAVLGAAGVVAIGGAGLYAGTMTTSALGTLGSGSALVQAACVDTLNKLDVTPQQSTFNSSTQKYEFAKVNVTALVSNTNAVATTGLANCVSQVVTLNIYAIAAATGGSVNANPITGGPVTAGETITSVTAALSNGAFPNLATTGTFELTLGLPVPASISATNYSYGIVIQAP